MLVRACQALAAAELFLSAAEGPATTADTAAGGAHPSDFEGDETAAMRKLHELGPSAAGR